MDKLLIVGFIQEVMYLDWIVNVIVIKKKKKRALESGEYM